MDLQKIQKRINTFQKKHHQKLRYLGHLKLYKKIPTLIWATFAVIGILLVGILLGLSNSKTSYVYQNSDYDAIKLNNSKYLEVIRGYESLTDLYSAQDNNLATILNVDTLRNNPEQTQQALIKMGTTKDQILIQIGRLLELRKNANLPDGDLQKAL